MLFLTTLKGITRDGSLETIAEVAHPGAGGDASAVCNRYQDVISSTPEGDALRARYAQVLFILDNQVRSQLEFPPPSLEVTAESTGSGEGDLSGEGGAGCPQIQQLEEYLAKLNDEQLRESFARVEFAENATREEMVAAIINYVKRAYDDAKAQLEVLSDEELIAQASEAGIEFKEGATREEVIAAILDGPSIDLPHPDKGASTTEGNSGGGAPPTGEPDLLSGAGSGEAKPGSLSPKGKGKGK